MHKVLEVFEVAGLLPNEVFSFTNNTLEGYYTITPSLALKEVTPEGELLTTSYELGLVFQNLYALTTNSKLSLTLLQKELANAPTSLLECLDVSVAKESSAYKYLQVLDTLRYLSQVYPDKKWDGCEKHYYYFYDATTDKVAIGSTLSDRRCEFYFPTKNVAEGLLRIIGENNYKNYMFNKM